MDAIAYRQCAYRQWRIDTLASKTQNGTGRVRDHDTLKLAIRRQKPNFRFGLLL
jgi:hypothetical protein